MLTKFLSLTVTFIFLITVRIQAQQNLFFKFKDGTTATYSVNEVRNFSFSGNLIVLKKKDGTTINWNTSTISNYRFDAITSITDAERINNAEVKIYPNPFKGAVRILYVLPVADKVAVDILDMQGRIVRSWPFAQKSAGNHELLWQVSNNGSKTIPSGTYICRITSTKGNVSKKMMIE
jgi:hypothetical protein